MNFAVLCNLPSAVHMSCGLLASVLYYPTCSLECFVHWDVSCCLQVGVMDLPFCIFCVYCCLHKQYTSHDRPPVCIWMGALLLHELNEDSLMDVAGFYQTV